MAKLNKITDGIGVVTWQYCHICGRKLKSDSAMLRGFCTADGCNYKKERVDNDKNNKFYNLSKFPKNKKSNYPVLNHILVILKDARMVCKMAKFATGEDAGFEFQVMEFDGVSGECFTCVPRNTFVDVLQSINNEYFQMSQGKDNILIINGKDFKNTIKCIDAREFPLSKGDWNKRSIFA